MANKYLSMQGLLSTKQEVRVTSLSTLTANCVILLVVLFEKLYPKWPVAQIDIILMQSKDFEESGTWKLICKCSAGSLVTY